jgi:hypothetical protein
MAGKDIPLSVERLMHLSSVLGCFGFAFSKNRTHAVEFKKQSGECIYVKTTGKLSNVMDPRMTGSGLVLGGISGSETWNSNFSSFPRAKRNGLKPEKFGIAFDLAEPMEAEKVLRAREVL